MNNAVFGKTMENVREHVDFELVSNVKRLENMSKQSYLQEQTFYQ